MKLLLAAIGLTLLSGCAQTTGKRTEVPTEIVIRDNYNCLITISPVVDQESLTGDIKELSSDNRPDIPIELSAPVSVPVPTSVAAAKELVAGKIKTDVISDLIESVTIPPELPVSVGGTTYITSELKNGAYPPGYDWIHKFETTEIKDGSPVWTLPAVFCSPSTPSQCMFSDTPYLTGDKENFDGQFFVPHSNESKSDGASWDAANCTMTGWVDSEGDGRTLFLNTQGNPLD